MQNSELFNPQGRFRRVTKTLLRTPTLATPPTVMRNDEIRRNDRKSSIDRPDYRKRYLHEQIRKLS
jgi:hypothetical protein